MILYAVECYGEITDFQNSIVTIWKTKENAEQAMQSYIQNCQYNNYERIDYHIKEIDTDKEDCVYDYEEE